MVAEQARPTEPRPATEVRQSAARGRVLRLVGWPTAVLGLLILLADQSRAGQDHLPWFDQTAASPARALVYGALGWILLGFGRTAARAGRRHLARVLTGLDDLPEDQRIVLFLRSFSDDEGFAHQQSGPQAIDYGGSTRTEEEQIAGALAPFGRMVALGRPGETLPQAGAERHFASDEDWQKQVLAALKRANLVVLAAGPGPNLLWEVKQIVARDRPTEVILLVSRDSRQYRDFRESVGSEFRGGLPDYTPTGATHAIGANTYTKAVIWFQPDWTPHLCHLDGGEVPASPRNWVGSTLSHALAPVYASAGVAQPGRLVAWTLKVLRGCRTRITAQANGIRRRFTVWRWRQRTMPASSADTSWRARRARTGGVEFLLWVSDGRKRHTVEYRSYRGDRAAVLVKRRVVGRGPRCLDRQFRLGRRGPVARLLVDANDYRLWVGGRQVFSARDGAPSSDAFLERRAMAIRDRLLAAPPSFPGPFRVKLRIAPRVSHRDAWVVTDGADGWVAVDPVIALLRSRSDFGVAGVWLTDRAVHIGHDGGQIFISYLELAAGTVTADHLTLHVGPRAVRLPGHAEHIARLLALVREVVVAHDAVFGAPPAVQPDEPRPERGSPMDVTWAQLAMSLSGFGAFIGASSLIANPDDLVLDGWPWLLAAPVRMVIGAGAGVVMMVGMVVAFVLVFSVCRWFGRAATAIVSLRRRVRRRQPRSARRVATPPKNRMEITAAQTRGRG
ncbi:hypothetical protein [Kutzneria sp. CA-103260]|uniref:hypothetical protein n=1 Tax=Kutzneria sp. CA-103260 TaxID=2802641 RepID=UPI001BA4EE34|nr:hypothetical protein [Kutzneria sp. CA-103260]QUQ64292.1 hypothetical protein JJ691_20120 [Kutzneria sp. CA-103260]